MEQYISKDAIAAEIERRMKRYTTVNACSKESDVQYRIKYHTLMSILSFLDTIEVKESDETAEAFARIIRANLTGIDKDVQHKFEQLYNEITGEKMYQGYND